MDVAKDFSSFLSDVECLPKIVFLALFIEMFSPLLTCLFCLLHAILNKLPSLDQFHSMFLLKI